MAWRNSLDDAARAVDTIIHEIKSAIGKLKRKFEGTQGLTPREEKKLLQLLGIYEMKLKLVAAAIPAGPKKQFAAAKKHLLYTQMAPIFAVIRAIEKSTNFKIPSGKTLYEEIIGRAKKLSVWESLSETVVVIWVEKSKGGFRPIVKLGLMRTAQQLVVRDMLSVMGIDSPFDHSKKGGEGERGLIKNVCKDIVEGYNWWWTPDIKNCFPSIQPGHFRGLWLDRRLLLNVIYLPECAKIKVAGSANHEAVLKWLLAAPLSNLPVAGPNMQLHTLTVQLVRRGLVQGSVISPLLARAAVARVLRSAVSDMDIKKYTYIDDLSVGARTKGAIKAVKQAVTEQFASLPAGKIELHDDGVRRAASRKVEVLGYFLEPGNGYGDNCVHVKPGPKRFRKFRSGLKQRLDAKPREQARAVADKYQKDWFRSQQAWTKVPFQSARNCFCATMSYVDDYLDGIPIGTTKLNKPPLKKVGYLGQGHAKK